MKQFAVILLSLALLLSLTGCELKSDTPKYIEDGLKAEEQAKTSEIKQDKSEIDADLPINNQAIQSEQEDNQPTPELESEADDDASTEPKDLPEQDSTNSKAELKLESKNKAE